MSGPKGLKDGGCLARFGLNGKLPGRAPFTMSLGGNLIRSSPIIYSSIYFSRHLKLEYHIPRLLLKVRQVANKTLDLPATVFFQFWVIFTEGNRVTFLEVPVVLANLEALVSHPHCPEERRDTLKLVMELGSHFPNLPNTHMAHRSNGHD